MSYLFNIQPENVNSVYMGKQGCACGCRGQYKEDQGTAKRRLTRLTNLQNKGVQLEVNEGFGGEWIVCWERENAATRIYVQQDLSEFQTPKSE